jgi:hypothetical protein
MRIADILPLGRQAAVFTAVTGAYGDEEEQHLGNGAQGAPSRGHTRFPVFAIETPSTDRG